MLISASFHAFKKNSRDPDEVIDFSLGPVALFLNQSEFLKENLDIIQTLSHGIGGCITAAVAVWKCRWLPVPVMVGSGQCFGSGSTWIRIDLAPWYRIQCDLKSWIRIRIETNGSVLISFLYPDPHWPKMLDLEPHWPSMLDPDTHWFGSLDPDLDPDQHWFFTWKVYYKYRYFISYKKLVAMWIRIQHFRSLRIRYSIVGECWIRVCIYCLHAKCWIGSALSSTMTLMMWGWRRIFMSFGFSFVIFA